MTDSAAERKARERALKRAAGLVRLEFWVPASLRAKVEKAVDRVIRSAKHDAAKSGEGEL